MITHTITWLELSWTVLAFIGMVFSLFVFRYAVQNMLVAQATPSGDQRRLIAGTSFFTETTRLLIQTIFFSIGVLAMTQPSIHIPHLPTVIRVEGILITWGLMTAAALLDAQGILVFRMLIKVNRGPRVHETTSSSLSS